MTAIAVVAIDQLPSPGVVLLPPLLLLLLPPLLLPPLLLPPLLPLSVLEDLVVNVIVAPLSDWVPAVGDMPVTVPSSGPETVTWKP